MGILAWVLKPKYHVPWAAAYVCLLLEMRVFWEIFCSAEMMMHMLREMKRWRHKAALMFAI